MSTTTTLRPVEFVNWDIVDYQDAWDRQEVLFSKIVQQKIAARDIPIEQQKITDSYLIFCQHPHVYTLGKSGKPEHLLLDEVGLKKAEAVYYKINRGGDITYHGPGQIVGYPIVDIETMPNCMSGKFGDIHKYLRLIEDSIILTLKEYGIESSRYDGFTGVWIDADKPTARKICAIGVRCSRWVTMHGFAFNVNTNLDYFKNIVPCGIDDKDVTSMERELGIKQNVNEVSQVLKKHLAVQLGIQLK
jgi:lipoyl(octanoyl) transferase